MSYDSNFYKMYAEYLQEPIVRNAHQKVFAFISGNRNFEKVVDFGCGQAKEFETYYKPSVACLNLDKHADGAIKVDYRHCNLVDVVGKFEPKSFVSLFSIEATAPVEENYALYHRIFAELPTIRSGLVSGFYYTNRLHENPVTETGDVVSYQTLEKMHVVKSDAFTELRIILPVPSKMFGSDVVEVWKVFERLK